MKRHASDGWRNIWRIAGSLNLDPRPLTLRQLIWMTEGRDRFAWSVASAMMALIANCHKDARSKSFAPDDFNPALTKEEKRSSGLLITDENVEIMRDEFKQVFQNVTLERRR